MKINGEDINNEEALFGPVVIVRGDKKFGFWATPVGSFEEFDLLYPMPDVPVTGWNAKTGKKEADPKNPAYKEAIEKRQAARWGFLVLKSLEPSNLDLSDQGVSIDDPETWHKVEDALRYSEANPGGLPHFEYGQVMRLVDEANTLDAERMEANRESFLSEMGRSQVDGPTSPSGEASSSQSGQLVNAGE
jgi:hypothetical protein